MLRKDLAYSKIKDLITSGEYPSGSKLPAEQTLAASLQLSRNTVRAALDRLQKENMIEKNGRSGNYVTDSGTPQRFIFITFSRNLDELGVVDSCFVSELQNVLNKKHHSLILFPAKRLEQLSAQELTALLKNNGISGIFLHRITFNRTPELLEMVRSSRIPVVEFGNNLSANGAFASVCADIRQAFADGVRYLAMLGYKRIATIFKADSMRGFTRNTYEDFLNSLGLAESIPLIFDTSIIKENKLPDLVNSPERPEAFMCFCDCTAMKVINILHQCKINVPDDVAVMGISGYLERLFVTPPLSTVNFHYDLMAEEAVKLMLNNTEWFLKEPAVIRYVSHEIVPRGTTPEFISNNK